MSELKFIYPDMVTVPEGADVVTIHAVVESSLADKWLAVIGGKPWKIKVEDVYEFGFDCGGIAYRDEPILSCDLGDWTLKTRVRRIEYLASYVRKTRDDSTPSGLGPHVFIGGYWCKAILTIETAKRIADWLETVLPMSMAESDQLWAAHLDKMASMGVHVPERRL